MRHFQALHCRQCTCPHLRRDYVIWPYANGAKEARHHQFQPFDIASTLGHQIVADQPDVRPQIKDVPAILAHDSKYGVGPEQWITFARDGFDEGGFAASVWTKDGDVFTALNTQVEAIEGEPVSTLNVNVLKLK